jgi:polyisoprenoid-binding protein YceI
MTWTLDRAHTNIGFSAKHLGVATVRGRFTDFEAELSLDENGDPVSGAGRVEIKTASIDTGNAQRDQHLRAADFFDVENHPTMVFEGRSVTPKGDGEYEVTGDLTIKGVTKPVTLAYEHSGLVHDPMGNTKVGGTLTGTVNRSDWGLSWNVPFGEGGLLVSDKIKLEIDVEAILEKQPAATGGAS